MGKYILAQTLEEALDALERYRDKARVISGATDLLPLIKNGEIKVDCIVDITNVTDLNYINYDNGLIRIGALVTHSEVESSPIISERATLLAEASRFVGSPQIRNRGTVVGNVANASRAADTPLALIALDAEAKVVSKNRERIERVEDLFVESGQTSLKTEELITELRFQELRPEQGGAFIKLAKRRALAIAAVNVATVITVDKEKRVFSDARIAVGCVVPKPQRAKRAEEALIGHSINGETIRSACQEIAEEVSPRTGIHGSAEYKREMTKILVARTIKNSLGRIKWEG